MGAGREKLTIKERKGILESDGTLPDFDLLKVIKLHFKRAEFISYKLHLNKHDFEEKLKFCPSDTSSQKAGLHGQR